MEEKEPEILKVGEKTFGKFYLETESTPFY